MLIIHCAAGHRHRWDLMEPIMPSWTDVHLNKTAFSLHVLLMWCAAHPKDAQIFNSPKLIQTDFSCFHFPLCTILTILSHMLYMLLEVKLPLRLLYVNRAIKRRCEISSALMHLGMEIKKHTCPSNRWCSAVPRWLDYVTQHMARCDIRGYASGVQRR